MRGAGDVLDLDAESLGEAASEHIADWATSFGSPDGFRVETGLLADLGGREAEVDTEAADLGTVRSETGLPACSCSSWHVTKIGDIGSRRQ